MRIVPMRFTERQPAVKGIIFDLDGTLYRMRWFFRPLLFLSLFPHHFRLPRFLEVRSGFAGKDLGSRERLISALCESLASLEGVSPEALERWILTKFYPAFVKSMPFLRGNRPGLSGTLRDLSRSGIRLAVLSDYHAVEERLRALRLPVDCFDIVDSCERAGALKPSPRPFSEIAARWGIAPDSILVVGDRDDTDGEAARRAGMPFMLIAESGKSPAPGSGNEWPEACKILAEIAHLPKNAEPITCSRESEESDGITLGREPG